MKVRLEYFKKTGKWYSSSEIHLPVTNWHEAVNQIKMISDRRCLPGLVKGHSLFIVRILPLHDPSDPTNEDPDEEGLVPHLLLPSEEEFQEDP